VAEQIKVVFSVIAREVITPAAFTSSDALAARFLAFQDRYNKTATPFGWKFSRADLDDLCRRIAARQAASSLIAA
jgi:hypothetical protein